jgi:hypothetical protein
MNRSRFRGEIVGVGSDSGVRFVVGRWRSSPLADRWSKLQMDTASSWPQLAGRGVCDLDLFL